MTDRLTIGSLFSGIGGLELGLERGLNASGIATDVRWQCEIEDYSRRVLAKHWPDTRRYTDVRTMGRDEDLEPVDLICGGFPCQDLSVAGKRAGLGGERSGLFWELIRIVRLVGPRYVVLENVPGLLTADQGEAMGNVLGALAESGYDAEWATLRASSLVGAPHHRDRWFGIAYAMRPRGPRLESANCPRPLVPWRWRGEEDLRAIAERPYGTGSRWPTPLLRRVDDGIPARVDRLRTLGNAVVPQVAEVLGRRIASLERAA